MEITLEDGTSLPLEEASKEQLAEHYEKVTQSLESYKASNPEHRTQEAQKLDRVIKVSRDSSKFIELYEVDPKMAKKVVEYNNKTYWEEFTVDDYLKQIQGEGKEREPEDEILSKVEAKLESREAAKTYKELLKKKDIDEKSDFGKDVISIYEDLIEWKKKTSDNVEKYLKIALREWKRTSEFADNYKKAVDDVQGIGSPRWWKSEPTRKPYTQQRASIFDYVKSK